MINYEIIIGTILYVALGVYMTSDLISTDRANQNNNIDGCGYAIAFLIFFPIIFIRMLFKNKKL